MNHKEICDNEGIQESQLNSELVSLERCISCGYKVNERDSFVDFDGWAVHSKCAGKYDLIVFEDGVEEKVLKGFESIEEAESEREEYFPEAKHWVTKKARA